MTLAPSQEEASRAALVQELRLARGYLAAWCPHGFDSSRASDYATAKIVREHIEIALELLDEPPFGIGRLQ